MRTITKNDREALSAAFFTFMKNMDGRRTQVKSLAPVIEKALDGGLTVDEIFNLRNYSRAQSVQENPTAAEYIDILLERQIDSISLNDEEQWEDNISEVTLLSNCIHDYYIAINPKGGTWNTDNARNNLYKVIRRNSLQGIMSEKLIDEVAEKLGAGKDMTLFQYIETLLKKADEIDVDNGLTEEQEDRCKQAEEFFEQFVDDDNEAEIEADDNEAEMESGLKTEGLAKEDTDIFEAHDWVEEEEPIVETHFINQNPQEYKKHCLSQVIMSYPLEDINALASVIINDTREPLTLERIINALTNGRYDRDKEDSKSYNCHQNINQDLTENWSNCLQMQGIEVDNEILTRCDPMLDSWDMRDEKTRKIQKLAKLIYNFGEEDIDLLNALKDLEDKYSES